MSKELADRVGLIEGERVIYAISIESTIILRTGTVADVIFDKVNYYLLISELYLLRKLDDMLKQGGARFLKLKTSKALMELWGVPTRTFKRKERDIKVRFELVFSPRG